MTFGHPISGGFSTISVTARTSRPSIVPMPYIMESGDCRANVKYLFHFFAFTKQFSNLWHSTRLLPRPKGLNLKWTRPVARKIYFPVYWFINKARVTARWYTPPTGNIISAAKYWTEYTCNIAFMFYGSFTKK